MTREARILVERDGPDCYLCGVETVIGPTWAPTTRTVPRKAKHEVQLDVDEVRGFLASIDGDRFEALYIVALRSGTRCRASGLDWANPRPRQAAGPCVSQEQRLQRCADSEQDRGS